MTDKKEFVAMKKVVMKQKKVKKKAVKTMKKLVAKKKKTKKVAKKKMVKKKNEWSWRWKVEGRFYNKASLYLLYLSSY